MTMQNSQVLDLMRSVAIVHVVLFHVLHGIIRFVNQSDLSAVLSRYPVWMNFAWQPFGVDVIFMISAYLLSLGLIQNLDQTGTIDIRAYYIRRVSRIIPLYYVAIIIFAIAQKDTLTDVFLAATFVQFLFTGKAIVPVGWSMELMMLVYICLPAIIWGLMQLKRPLLWLCIAIVISLAVRFVALAAQPDQAVVLFTHLLDRDGVLPLAEDLYFRPWFRLTPFILGITLAISTRNSSSKIDRMIASAPQRISLYISAAILMYLALFLPIHDPQSWIYAATSPLFWVTYWTLNGAAFAVAACLTIIAGHGTNPVIRGPWAMISRNIMGIYLFHMPLILVGAVITFRSTQLDALAHATVWHVWGVFTVAMLLSLGLSAVLNRFIEAPIQMALRRKMGL